LQGRHRSIYADIRIGRRSRLHPFEPEAANLFFQLVSSRYERASLIVTSNKPFGRWGEVYGDDVVAAAMIDRLVHHAEVIALKGDSYRLKDRDLGRVPAATKTNE
jgi:DNA replication protein DnaC